MQRFLFVLEEEERVRDLKHTALDRHKPDESQVRAQRGEPPPQIWVSQGSHRGFCVGWGREGQGSNKSKNKNKNCGQFDPIPPEKPLAQPPKGKWNHTLSSVLNVFFIRHWRMSTRDVRCV